MGKVFRYELHRLVYSKIFLGLLIVLSAYGWQMLSTETILGVAHTAPFSPWSFGCYLTQLLPLLSLSLLFFLWDISSGKAKRVEILSSATPVEPGKLMAVKGLAVAAAWGLLALVVAGMGIAFLLYLFKGAVPVWQLLGAAALALLPPLIFLLGAGLLAGRKNAALVLILVPAAALLALLPLPAFAQLFPTGFFSEYPLTLGLDPALRVSAGFLLGRAAYTAIGLGLAICATKTKAENHGRP